MGTEQKNLDVPLKVTGKTVYGIDVRVPGMKWAAVKACPVYGGDVKSYDFDAVRAHARRPLRRAVPDSGSGADPRPRLQRRRRRHRRHLVPGQDRARSACRSSGTIPPEHAAFNTANMRDGAAGGARPARQRARQSGRRATRGFARAAKIVEATYSTPYLPRARMEPGNATVLVTDDRVDIWIGDQSPQETRFSASKITGIPEENVYLHMCHLGGGFGRNGNGPQAEQAIMIANANRGTPIHLLWTREEDFIGTTYRAMGVARLQGRRSTPTAGRSRSKCARPCSEDGFGPDASFDVASRYYVPNYRFSNHTTKFHVPVGTRRGVGQAAHEFYRESFMDELAHAAGKDPYRYRRELIARTNLPYKDDMIKALDMAAEMSGWGTPLPQGHGARDRASRNAAPKATAWRPSAPWSTPSRSAARARCRLERVDVAHDTGFGLVNPLSVKKQIEGQITWFYNDAMHQATHDRRRAHRREQLQHVPAVAHRRGPARDQHPLLPDRALADRHGPRPRHFGPIRDRRRDLPDHRQALPGSAVRQARSELELRARGHTTRLPFYELLSTPRSRLRGFNFRSAARETRP